MFKRILAFAFFAAFAVQAFPQNLSTVSASNLTDINGTKLAAGQLCFLITDQQDNPISVSIGGGGQSLRRGYCSPVASGVVTSFTVPTPAATSPAGIYYRVTVKDSSTGQEVLRYSGVTFTGATFNFDSYAPLNLGSFAALTGNSVSGNLSVSGNVAATGTVTGSNIPSSILQQIFNQGTGLTQRTAVNCLAGVVCSDNAGTSRTDLRLGTLTTVTFSATPTFDASTATSFLLTLTANVTSSTLSNAVPGEPINIEICQNATGGFTFVAPTNVKNFAAPPAAANACILESFVYDGTNAVADQSAASQVLAQDGSAGAPSISFENANTTGFHRNGTSIVQDAAGAADSSFSFGGHGQIVVRSDGLFGFSATTTQPAAADTSISRVSAGVTGCGTGTSGSTAGECDMRTLGITGSTSGKTSIVTDAIASGTPTLKAGTYNIVGDSLTQTLTNKTLTSPIISGGLAGLTPGKQIFTASGTFTIPSGITGVKVTVIGGGGGGGGAAATPKNGGGGGSGSLAIKWLTGLTPGNTLAVVIGTAGSAGATGAAGGNGGASSVASGTQTITSIIANGGGGGSGVLAASPGGAGGSVGSGGDLNLSGASGGFGNSANNIGGNGAPSFFSGGGAQSGGAGVAGTSLGDGGGGAGGAGANAGGAGSAGVVVFEWTN